MGSFRIGINDPQPSQLYISEVKLTPLREALIARPHLALEPVPLKELDGEIIFTDGHTRALAALLAGRTEIDAYWDADELDWSAYRTCVRWCRDAGVQRIADLRDRVVSPADYACLWLARCRRLHEGLGEGG